MIPKQPIEKFQFQFGWAMMIEMVRILALLWGNVATAIRMTDPLPG